MIVKGIDTRMPPLVTSAELAEVAPSNVTHENVTSLEKAFRDSLNIRSPSPPSQHRPQTSRAGMASGLSFSSSAASSSASSGLSSSRTTGSPSPQVSPSPIIYVHVRTFRGVLESRYHYFERSQSTQARARVLGAHAAHYLVSHGYSRSDIDIIIKVHQRAISGREFALELAGLGMALAEGFYLWDMINL
ncbi:hypothetical protein HYDPIDRAFT_35023 [Hydnomerulius pinastri MD-312]|uniref:Uncharacterized protein n=1 Tax=Hydnomerulius pinastri MD-312 TaxID=994086 RepID=A0A0C2KJG4_9AGAM|nr:hypothetical protein HYDPIDRAFT_35023 [Hydnomerulius pinastri MD-312]